VRDVNGAELTPGGKWAPPLRARAGEERLFDVLQDPDERNDLARDRERTAVLDELRAATLEWWRKTGGGELPERR
jgi:hypothetical protein